MAKNILSCGWVEDVTGSTVLSSPFTDIDTFIPLNPDGTINQIVITGLGQTKTLVFSYGVNSITIACVIT